MLLPKFTAEASIGNHESYADAKGKYKKYDSSVKIEPQANPLCTGFNCHDFAGYRTCLQRVCDYFDDHGRLWMSTYIDKFSIIKIWETSNPPVEP